MHAFIAVVNLRFTAQVNNNSVLSKYCLQICETFPTSGNYPVQLKLTAALSLMHEPPMYSAGPMREFSSAVTLFICLVTVILCIHSLNNFGYFIFTLKEINSQTDYYLVRLSSKTYVFEDKMTKC